MAMTKCPECKNDVSDKAINCIHCGYPINFDKTDLNHLGALDIQTSNSDLLKLNLIAIEGSKVPLIKAIREITNLNLAEAKNIVDYTPSTIIESFDKNELIKYKDYFKLLEAKTEISTKTVYTTDMTKKCNSCGTECALYNKVCKKCGYIFYEGNKNHSSISNTNNNINTQMNNNNNGSSFWSIVFAIVVGLVIFAFC